MQSIESPSERTVHVAGCDILVRSGGAGPDLVIIHHDIGNGGWDAFHQALAERFTVHVPDLPGYGKSTRAEWARHPRDLAAVVNLVADALELGQISVVGLGFGGWIAAELATFAQARMRHLTLVAPMGVKPESGDILDQFLISHEDYITAGLHDPTVLTTLFGAPAPVEQLMTWDIARESTSRIAWKPYMFNRSLDHLLQSVTLPTLVVWGDDDRIVPPSCAAQYIAKMKGATTRTIEDAGHWVDLEQPRKLADLIISAATGG